MIFKNAFPFWFHILQNIKNELKNSYRFRMVRKIHQGLIAFCSEGKIKIDNTDNSYNTKQTCLSEC